MGLSLSEKTSTRINIIRIAASWFVMIGHGFVFFQISVFKNQDAFCYIQNIGVVLLLLLAGFLLAYTMQRKSPTGYRFRDFLTDKACRLKIPLLAALLFTILFDTISRSLYPSVQPVTDSSVGTFIGNYFMLQLYPAFGIRILCYGSAAQLWTLSVEWWFFVATACCFLGIKRGTEGKKPLVVLQVIGFAVCLYSLLEYTRIGVVPNAPVIMILGMGIYYGVPCLVDQNKIILKALSAISLVSAIKCGTVVKDAYDHWFVVSIALSVLFLFASTQTGEQHDSKGERKADLGHRVISFLSGYSYSLYLVHYSIFDLFYRKWIVDGMVMGGYYLTISIVLSNALSILLYFMIEKHTSKIARFIKAKI